MKTYVVEDITEFLDNCTDEEMRELLDDNGGSPDGNAWLPLERISEAEARSVWAQGPDGFIWYGRNIGDNDIVTLRRTKGRV